MLSHGLYSKRFAPGSLDAADKEGVTLRRELAVARCQLDRALAKWEEWSGEVLPVDSIKSVQDGEHRLLTVRRRRPDLWGIINTCLGRIGHLASQAARIDEMKELEERLARAEAKLAGVGTASG